MEGMSDGTQDQLYLALRLASIEGFQTKGKCRPSSPMTSWSTSTTSGPEQPCRSSAELSRRTQVILFTHHLTLIQLAQRTLPPELLSVHYLGKYLPWRS